ncbi:MAG: biopolymer transporter ExbD [Polyangiaceae bacterium]|nr:biopolymer transporter ExbD [Polyangiaceae bacterium]
MASAKKSASATFTRSVKQPEPEINVTPLVDVVLVLLIIFMVIAPNLQEGTPVVLPEIDAVDKEKHEDNIEIVMTADGKLWLDDKETTREAVLSELEKTHEARPERVLILKADAQLPYSTVRELFASIQKTGFRNVSLKVSTKNRDGET